MNLDDAVQSQPEIQGGTPCFKGTRVPVDSLFSAIEHGRSLDYFLEQFPAVSREQALAVLKHVRGPFRRRTPGQDAA